MDMYLKDLEQWRQVASNPELKFVSFEGENGFTYEKSELDIAME